MELNPTYLSYKEYEKLGGNVDEVSFPILEYRAEKEIDKYTFNRFRKITKYPNELKMCIYDLISFINDKYSSNNSILSETVDRYSITKKDNSELNKEYYNIVANYLQNVKVNGVPVLYRGADINDD